jgi:predicted nucleotidyltransferase
MDSSTSLMVRRSLRRVVQEHQGYPVVLVGSFARAARPHELSDIDLLVVDDGEPGSGSAELQIVAIPATELRERAAAGDDFVQWALRFGEPISARRKWQELRDQLLPSAPWPDPVRSVGRAKRALQFSRDLVAMGDVPAAQEQSLLGLSHAARAALLKARVFPLSRPELPEQLESIGEQALADSLRRLMQGELSRGDISQANDVAIRLLTELGLAQRTSS